MLRFRSSLALASPGLYPPSFAFLVKLLLRRGLDQNPLSKGESCNDSTQAKVSNPHSICLLLCFDLPAALKCSLLSFFVAATGPTLC